MSRGYNLTRSIVEDLGVAIVSGEFTSDDPFPIEAELCEQYNASRTVLREAVKRLTAKGLLSARPRQGTRVEPESNWALMDPDVLRWLLERKFSLQLLVEFTEIRMAVEPAAAKLAAERINPESKLALETALERMEAAESGKDDPLASDIAFHIAILHASENRFYSEFEDLIESALRFSIRFTNQFKGVKTASVDDHRKIYRAIVQGKGAAAQRAVETLIGDALALMNKAIAKEAKKPVRKKRSKRK